MRLQYKTALLSAAAAASLSLLLALPAAHASLVTNGSFENTADIPTGGPPTTTNHWSGDNSTYLMAENGIAPFDGNLMLKFINTGNIPGSGGASELAQLIDASGLSAGVLLQASMYVNRVAGDSATDTSFTIDVRAFPGTPASYPSDLGINELGTISASILSDADVNTWELVQTNPWSLPASTGYLAVRLVAIENVFNDTVSPEFDGHYADLASLAVVPEASVFAFWGLLTLGVGLLRIHTAAKLSAINIC
jgi:hypothetical protein